MKESHLLLLKDPGVQNKPIEAMEFPQLPPGTIVKKNNPAYIIDLLRTNASLHITPGQFSELVNRSSTLETSNSLVQSSRRVENSGVIPHLVDATMTTKKANKILTTICIQALKYIDSLPPEVQDELYFSYLPGRGVTPRALVVGNEVWKKILNEVRKYREGSLIAQDLRYHTGHELEQTLYFIQSAHPFIHRKINDDRNAINSPIYHGTPVQYFPYYTKGALSYLEQVVIGVDFERISYLDPHTPNQGKEVWTTVAEVIRSITPNTLKHSNNSEFHFVPKNPLSLLLVAGKASHPLVRSLTEYLETHYSLSDLISHPVVAVKATENFFERIQNSL